MLAVKFNLRRWLLRWNTKSMIKKKTAVKEQLYGGIIEMMNNRSLFYRSSVGRNHEYSHWTDEGKAELHAFVEDLSRKMLLAEEADLDARAKELVLETLKTKESQ